jgi:hypothetical protein
MVEAGKSALDTLLHLVFSRLFREKSIAPALVPDGQALQGLAVGLPFGHELVHEGDEAGVVRGFKEMDHFVDDEVFENGTAAALMP